MIIFFKAVVYYLTLSGALPFCLHVSVIEEVDYVRGGLLDVILVLEEFIFQNLVAPVRCTSFAFICWNPNHQISTFQCCLQVHFRLISLCLYFVFSLSLFDFVFSLYFSFGNYWKF